ncbi:glucose starvation-inducible protein B, partial [Bacillus subtilis]
FYQEIGRKGGEATSKNHDKEFYQEIGSKGGNARNND